MAAPVQCRSDDLERLASAALYGRESDALVSGDLVVSFNVWLLPIVLSIGGFRSAGISPQAARRADHSRRARLTSQQTRKSFL